MLFRYRTRLALRGFYNATRSVGPRYGMRYVIHPIALSNTSQ